MNISEIISSALLFLVLMDPFGNLPVFVSMLGGKNKKEYRDIILRESCFALAAMIATFLTGSFIMEKLGITSSRLGLAGGLILLLMGIRMVFYTLNPQTDSENVKEPYIVPLAIPLICGPGLIAVLVTVQQNVLETLLALACAWCGQLLILLCGKKIASILGNKALDALESLMGLLLTGISIGMILDNLKLEFAGF